MSGLGEIVLPSGFAMLRQTEGWRVVGMGIGIIILVLAFLMQMYVRDKKPVSVKHRTDVYQDLRWALKNKNLWLLGLFTGFVFAHFAVMANMWNVVFLQIHFGLSLGQAIFENSLVVLGYTIGCCCIGYGLKVFSSRRLMLLCSIVVFVCQVTLTFYHIDVYLEGFVLFILGLATGVVVLSYDLAEKIAPSSSYGVAAGFITMFFGAVGMLLVPLVGYLTNFLLLDIYLASAPVVLASAIGLMIAIRINLSPDFAFCEEVVKS